MLTCGELVAVWGPHGKSGQPGPACCSGSPLFQTPRRHSTTGTLPDAAAAQARFPADHLLDQNGLWCFDPGLQAFVQRFPGEFEREWADGVDGVEVTATDREPFPIGLRPHRPRSSSMHR